MQGHVGSLHWLQNLYFSGQSCSLLSCVCVSLLGLFLTSYWIVNEIFFPIYFAVVILGPLASHKVLYIYFVTGHYTEFSFQLEERFHPVASLGCFSPGPSEAVAQQPRPIPWLSRGLVGPQLRLEEEALSPQEHPGVHLQAKYFSHEGASFTSVGILVRNYRTYFTTNSKHTS